VQFREAVRRDNKAYAHAAFIDTLIMASDNQTGACATAPAVWLSTRELGILDLVAQLKSNKEISRAEALGLIQRVS
jgi:LuxR family transcriptional regulator, maltose regulon positive regulatory protein